MLLFLLGGIEVGMANMIERKTNKRRITFGASLGIPNILDLATSAGAARRILHAICRHV